MGGRARLHCTGNCEHHLGLMSLALVLDILAGPEPLLIALWSAVHHLAVQILVEVTAQEGHHPAGIHDVLGRGGAWSCARLWWAEIGWQGHSGAANVFQADDLHGVEDGVGGQLAQAVCLQSADNVLVDPGCQSPALAAQVRVDGENFNLAARLEDAPAVEEGARPLVVAEDRGDGARHNGVKVAVWEGHGGGEGGHIEGVVVQGRRVRGGRGVCCQRRRRIDRGSRVARGQHPSVGCGVVSRGR